MQIHSLAKGKNHSFRSALQHTKRAVLLDDSERLKGSRPEALEVGPAVNGGCSGVLGTTEGDKRRETAVELAMWWDLWRRKVTFFPPKPFGRLLRGDRQNSCNSSTFQARYANKSTPCP